MEFAKSKETTERPSDDGSSLGPEYERVIEHAWLLKSAMRWVRNDGSPLNAFRWFVWDRLGIGDPPSRVERATADEVTTVTADPVPIPPNLSNRRRVQATQTTEGASAHRRTDSSVREPVRGRFRTGLGSGSPV